MNNAPKEKELLTQEEFDKLQDGTTVTIIWCGGNGPHDYFVKKDKNGNNRVLTDLDRRIGCEGDFVDSFGEHPLTQVWIK